MTTSDHAQDRILAHRQHQPLCEACCRSTTKRQAEVMNDGLQPRCASRRRRQNPLGEALSEDLAPAQDGVTAEAASDHQELDDPPRERQIGHASSIAAMDASGSGAPPTETGPSGLEGWTILLAGLKTGWAAGGGGTEVGTGILCKDSIFAVSASI